MMAPVSLFTCLLALFFQTNEAMRANLTRTNRQNMVAKAMDNMTTDKAMDVLMHHKNLPKGFVSMVQSSLGENAPKHHDHVSKRSLRGDKQTHLGLLNTNQDPDSEYGEGGVDAAEEMISEMITESQLNLDTEIERCTLFNTRTSAAMEELRQNIASANARAAAARAESLRANAQLEYIEEKIPELEDQLKGHKDQCEVDGEALNSQLDVVADDLEVMEKILNMSTCSESAALMQTSSSLMKCCQPSKKHPMSFLMLQREGPVANLKSPIARWSLDNTFPKVRAHFLPQHSFSLMQVEAGSATQAGMEYMLVGSDAETDSLTPTTATPTTPVITPMVCPMEAQKKCTVSDSPSCPRIQNKFRGVQADIKQKEDDLKLELANTEHECEQTRLNLEAQISDLQRRKVEEETALAGAQETIQTTTEELRLLQRQLAGFERRHKAEFGGCEILYGELKCEMTDEAGVCATNIDAYTTEICGLKKIRIELKKVEGDNMVYMSDIIDCEVSEWRVESCSKSCGGGVLKKERDVLVTPSHGATCPPLEVEEPCNINPCPIDCKMNDWSRWSSCSASCGGGIRERQRTIDIHPQFEGEPCPEATDSENCNMDSCDRDCTLDDWSEWCDCDKMCDGGMQKRMRGVAKEAYGEGQCFEDDSEERLEYQQCNTMSCEFFLGLTENHPYVECESKVDVILLLDGSGSLGQSGWDATKDFAKTFAQALHLGADSASLAAMVFSGPQTTSNFYYCMGWWAPDSDWDMSEGCRLTWVEHLTNDMAKVSDAIDNAVWPQGLTFTHSALELALSETSFGREGVPMVVIVVTDGYPTSMDATKVAAHKIKDVARLMFALVGSGTASMVASVHEMATQPYEQNVLEVRNFTSLTSPDTINHIVSDFCPEVAAQACPYTATDKACPWGPAVSDTCGDANNVFINGYRFTSNIASVDDALKICGGMCDSTPDCGGFNYRPTVGRCFFKNTVKLEGTCASAEIKEDNGAQCFIREDKSCQAVGLE